MGGKSSSTAKVVMSATANTAVEYTIPDQPARFAKAKEENNARVLDIESMYNGSFFKGLRVLVTGGNRGIGLALTKELVNQEANVVVSCRKSSDELDKLASEHGVEIFTDVDVTVNEEVLAFAEKVPGVFDVVINNAGYFYEPLETLDTLNFEEELKMIDICAVGPLRVSAALVNAGKVKENGGQISMITSQGGSISWRTVQNPTGHDYGHHMSKAAANMMSVLLAQELKSKGIIVSILHPGFNKTDMTKKYEHIWEIEGAVDSEVGAKRVCHEISIATLDTSGAFINCEDGLRIPF